MQTEQQGRPGAGRMIWQGNDRLGCLLKSACRILLPLMLAWAGSTWAATDTITTLTVSPNPSVAGQSVELTATVAGNSPGGTVTFMDGAAILGTATLAAGQATYTAVLNTAGTHSLVASYGGDANNQPSASAAVTQTVSAATTTVAVTTSINPSVAGQAISWTATVTGALPTGTITFMNETTNSGTYTIPAGQTSATRSITFVSVGPGTRNLTAIYSGDANNQPSTSPVYVQTVNKSPTTTTLTATPGPSVTGQPVTLTATVTGYAPLGTVTFMDGATVLGTTTLASKTASINVAFSTAGTHSLTAVYGGNVNYLASTSEIVTQTVNQSVATITLSSAPNPAMAGQAVALTATVAGASPTGTITFMDGTSTLGTALLASETATLNYTFAEAGSHSLSAVYSGDANNAPGTSTAVAQTINTATSTTTLSATPNPATAGQAVALTASISGALPNGTVSFYEGSISLGAATVAAGQATLNHTFPWAGTRDLTASYSGDTNNQSSTSATLSLAGTAAKRKRTTSTQTISTHRG